MAGNPILRRLSVRARAWGSPCSCGSEEQPEELLKQFHAPGSRVPREVVRGGGSGSTDASDSSLVWDFRSGCSAWSCLASHNIRPLRRTTLARERVRRTHSGGSLDKMSAAPEDAPGTPVRPSPGTTVVTPTKVGPDEWRRDGVGGHTPEDFYARAAALKGAPTAARGAGVGVVGLTHELSEKDAESFYVQVADLKGGAHAERTRREREERRLSMEREFREILPHTSIGKRREGWQKPVYWKDKDPRAPPPDASGGSDAAALCAAAAAARREAAAARLRPDEPCAAPPVDRAVSAAAYDIGDAITRPKVEPDHAPIEWVAPPKRPTSPDGFDFFPDIDARDDSNRTPSPPPGAWWWERLAHGVQNCGPLIEACGDPCHTVVDDDTYPAPAGWNPPPRVRRGQSPPRAPPRGGGNGPA